MSVEEFKQCNTEQQVVLKFWFGDEYPAKINADWQRWYQGSPELNAEIISKFKDLVHQAVDHKFDHWWTQGLHQCLALLIILDQFSMNIGRERGDTYGFHASAQSIPFSHAAVGRGYVEKAPEECRTFFILPLMHSENILDQDICIAMHKKLGIPMKFAESHYAAVEKFGRYPNRNKIYGRESTPEEEEYLKNFTGW